MKPLLTIDKWSGMSEDGGIFYSEGFIPENIGGNSVMSEDFKPVSLANRGTTNFSDFYGGVASVCSYLDEGGYGNLIFADNIQRLYKYELAGFSGKIHTIPATDAGSDFLASAYCTFLRMASGNFLYCGANHFGIGYYGLALTGSGTTKIIDTAGRNFATLGVVVGESTHNKVTNLDTGAEYTITSITTTHETNDTLNFTASGALTNANGDPFIVWIDDKIDLGTNHSATSPRKCEEYGDYYLMTFDNYLAILGADEATADADYKQLPVNSEALYLSVNGSKIMVCSQASGRGQLLFWDGYSDGWNNILDIDSIAYTLAPYKNGWLYMTNNTLYFTDGWNTQIISTYPDKDYAGAGYNLTPNYNGITVFNDMVFVADSEHNYMRICFSCYAFSFNYGWLGIPSLTYGLTNRLGYSEGSSVFVRTINASEELLLGANGNLMYYSETAEYSNAYMSRSLIQLINLEEPKQIKEIELNISHNLKEILDTSHITDTATITVNIGDAHRGIFARNEVKTGSTASEIIPYFKSSAEVGNEIQIMEDYLSSTEDTQGERSYITAITDPGEATESWTISPAFSAVPDNGAGIRVISVKKSDTKTVSILDLNKPVRFSVDGFYSNKIFVEVVITGGTTSFPVSIFDMKIYGE